MENKDKYKILFVCLGNICRSPSAEAVMKKLVHQARLDAVFEVDSAGIIGYHEGEGADPRMKAMLPVEDTNWILFHDRLEWRISMIST